MKVRFWGTRGSIPIALTAAQVRDKVVAVLNAAIDHGLCRHEDVAAFVDVQLPFALRATYGGHTSCVQLESEGAGHVFMDFGSGARPLGAHFLSQFKQPQTYHVFMSHLHWDHIMGFPFFTPVYIPGNRIIIHTCHAQAEFAFRQQQLPLSFPVGFDALAAHIEFGLLEPDKSYDIAGYTVSALQQIHSGDSFGWRFERNGKVMVYSTDSEHKLDDQMSLDRFVNFFRNADLVVFDAMYSLAEAISVRSDWGHSSNIVGVELAHAAKARRLCLFHHEPSLEDASIENTLEQTRRFESITRDGQDILVISAYDGLEVSL